MQFEADRSGSGRRHSDDAFRLNKPRPSRLTTAEVDRLLDNMDGLPLLVSELSYGSGMRLMECLRGRVKDYDFHRNEIAVRDGKGEKDRVTLLPRSLRGRLIEHLGKVRDLRQKDLRKRSRPSFAPTFAEAQLSYSLNLIRPW